MTVEVEALCVTLDSMSLCTSISVIDVLIEVIGGEIVVNNTAGTSFFCTSVGQQRFKRRGHGIQFIGVE